MPQALSRTRTFDLTDSRDDRPLHARKRLKPSDALVRSAVAQLLRRQVGQNAYEAVEDVIARIYDGCPATMAYIQRAATSPASTSTATWAAELIQSSTVDFLGGPSGKASCFAQLAAAGALVLQPSGLTKVPVRTATTLAGNWIAENGAKPVYAGTLSSTTVSLHKVAAISCVSEEMTEFAMPNVEAIISQMLRRDLNGIIDRSLIDTNVSSSLRPAGLFAGVTPLTASTATPPSEAMAEDISNLSAAIVNGSPDSRPVFIAGVPEAGRLAASGYQVVTCGFMASGTVGAVDVESLALVATLPLFAMSRSAAIHLEDTTPLPLGTGTQGSGVVAVPMHSTYQSDTIAIRSTMRAGWARLRSGATAIVAGVSW